MVGVSRNVPENWGIFFAADQQTNCGNMTARNLKGCDDGIKATEYPKHDYYSKIGPVSILNSLYITFLIHLQ
jgi:hypothetical protein